MVSQHVIMGVLITNQQFEKRRAQKQIDKITNKLLEIPLKEENVERLREVLIEYRIAVEKSKE